ncbi:hypothetical protein GCM10023340_43340 [Nocardioides marinquilinus]|uniref:Secreted protein n=1 Tax=Nocardioides marinquilinus TaxID=1210400 RepID=A0ABP9Q336_9ACTN
MTWLLGLLGLFALFGTSSAPPPSPPPSPATLVDSWSQSEHERLGEVDVEAQVIADDAARDALLADLPRSVDTSAVEAVDLYESVLVAGGYHRCTESSFVVLDDAGPRFEVDDGEPGVLCGWSPYTVDVWAVPRSALGG